MPPYDSDSSGGEDGDYTETDVLLGYANKEPKEETVSRLGGRPEWLSPDKAPSVALARCKVCKDVMVLLLQLNGELPERFPGHERRLYVFSCKRKTCWRKDGSIRALRGVRVTGSDETTPAQKVEVPRKEEAAAASTSPPAPKQGTGLGEALFGVKPMGTSTSANPFSTSSSTPSNPFSTSSSAPSNPFSTKQPPASTGPANPFSTTSPAAAPPPPPPPPPPSDPAKDLPKTFAETLTLNNPQTPSGPPPPSEPWPPGADQPAPYPVYWIADAEYETLDPTPLPRVPAAATTTAMDVDDPSAGGSGGKEDKVVFESSMDATFQKFADRIGQNPEQVIRYEFGGQPLLYSKEDAVGKALGGGSAGGASVSTSAGKGGMPRCGNCGAARVFEVQMTPQAITELEAEEEGMEGMDWGTIIVGVCERNCQEKGTGRGEAGYVEEWAGVQWEELSAKR